MLPKCSSCIQSSVNSKLHESCNKFEHLYFVKQVFSRPRIEQLEKCLLWLQKCSLCIQSSVFYFDHFLFCIPGFFKALYRIATNVSYMAVILGGCCYTVALIGNIVFMPKYLETQFSLPATTAPMIFGKYVTVTYSKVPGQ